MKVIKRDGTEEELHFDKVLLRIRNLMNDKSLGILKNIDPDVISQQVIKNIFDGVKTSELDEVASRIAIGMATEHPEYSELASRISISNLQKKTETDFSKVVEILRNNKTEDGIEVPLVSEQLFLTVKKNEDRLNKTLDYSRDFLFDYFGFKTLEKSYLLKIFSEQDKSYKIIERPQHMWLRVSLGIHGDDIERVIETYDLLSQMYFTHASPTLFNSGTPRPQLSSCFIADMEDSMQGIYKCLADCAMNSKHAGGIGINISHIRSKGSYIRGTNGRCDGLVKMLKVFNETARFANQGSKRNGSFAVYCPAWHEDIFEFLELRKNSGDEALRARDLFYAMWISDAFMQAVKTDDWWYLMSEDTNPGLTEKYGEEFTDLYYSYVSKGNYRKKIKARDLWQKILVSQIETGMPYMTYKDSVNKKCNQKNIGTIKSSNLCVSGDTDILTSKGVFKIKNLENQEVEVWNGKEFSKTTPVKTGKDKEVMSVIFNNGTELRCTPYHKFYIKTEDKEETVVEAQNLKVGAKLIDCDFPIIKEGLEDFEASYEHGLFSADERYFPEYFKYFSEREGDFTFNSHPPINYNLDVKLRWLEGFFDASNVRVGNDLVYLENSSLAPKYLILVRNLLQTVGANPVIVHQNLLGLYSSDIKTLVQSGFSPKKVDIKKILLCKYDTRLVTTVTQVLRKNQRCDTYCFNEPLEHKGIFNGVITGNCNEITLFSSPDETAVCNICTFSLPKYVEKKENGEYFYNYKKLYDVVKIATRNMNNIIDLNFYPTEETRRSNLKHRPIAMGIQGLANVFFIMKIPFESEEAKTLNKEIMETIQYAGWTASMELAREKGTTYSTYEGSPISKGVFQHNMWKTCFDETQSIWNWDKLRRDIQENGVMNSMVTALPPTASTSQILGNYESFEPQNSNMFMRSTMSGDFPIINKYLINDLIELGIWNTKLKEEIIRDNGSVQNIKQIPTELKKIYKTIWEIPQKLLIDFSADRGIFVDQTQSLNCFLKKPNIGNLTSMHFYSWEKGLKTGMYYLRSKPANQAEKFTVSQDVQKNKETLACSIDNREACISCSG